MNLLLLHQGDFTSSTEVKIFDRRYDHLTKIIKVQLGQSIDAGMLNQKLGTGKITAIDTKSVTLTVELDKNPPQPTPISLILALPRPLMLKRILQTITALGVKEVHLINTQRVEKSYWNSSDLAESVITQQLILGLEQSRDTVLPTISYHREFRKFMTQDLATITVNKQLLLADIGNHKGCPGNIQQAAVVAIGPEGGFIPEEAAQFNSAGFASVQIGKRPLRVEAAVTALIGRLMPV